MSLRGFAVVMQVKPNVLIGLAGAGKLFTEEVLTLMGQHNERPIIMPMSNPTHRMECNAREAQAATGAHAQPTPWAVGRFVHVVQMHLLTAFFFSAWPHCVRSAALAEYLHRQTWQAISVSGLARCSVLTLSGGIAIGQAGGRSSQAGAPAMTWSTRGARSSPRKPTTCISSRASPWAHTWVVQASGWAFCLRGRSCLCLAAHADPRQVFTK